MDHLIETLQKKYFHSNSTSLFNTLILASLRKLSNRNLSKIVFITSPISVSQMIERKLDRFYLKNKKHNINSQLEISKYNKTTGNL